MTNRKKDKPVYSFTWDGLALRPDMEYDRQALAGFNKGDKVRLDVKHWRNLDRLKAYWALLHDVIQATDCASHPTALHSYLKQELGLVDYVRELDGTVKKVEGSIAIESMGEAEFIAFFQNVERLVAERLGYVKEGN